MGYADSGIKYHEHLTQDQSCNQAAIYTFKVILLVLSTISPFFEELGCRTDPQLYSVAKPVMPPGNIMNYTARALNLLIT